MLLVDASSPFTHFSHEIPPRKHWRGVAGASSRGRPPTGASLLALVQLLSASLGSRSQPVRVIGSLHRRIATTSDTQAIPIDALQADVRRIWLARGATDQAALLDIFVADLTRRNVSFGIQRLLLLLSNPDVVPGVTAMGQGALHAVSRREHPSAVWMDSLSYFHPKHLRQVPVEKVLEKEGTAAHAIFRASGRKRLARTKDATPTSVSEAVVFVTHEPAPHALLLEGAQGPRVSAKRAYQWAPNLTGLRRATTVRRGTEFGVEASLASFEREYKK